MLLSPTQIYRRHGSLAVASRYIANDRIVNPFAKESERDIESGAGYKSK
jgi:hypothetical protein